MPVKKSALLKIRFSRPLFALLALFFVQASLAASAAADPGDDPAYNFPVLNENDFAFFLDFLDAVKSGGNFEELYPKHGITEERATGVIQKISANATAAFAGVSAELEKEYGKTILFNPEEKKLYEKHKDKILSGLSLTS
ncbi:MAG: hypothetical protein LBR53_06715 [Deltaproteobacteria bacterium]|jgi:hypothetical protein|nr:hypothetical protein [Deltaproteobacteria bacterium]